jgi:hypothetical protein
LERVNRDHEWGKPDHKPVTRDLEDTIRVVGQMTFAQNRVCLVRIRLFVTGNPAFQVRTNRFLITNDCLSGSALAMPSGVMMTTSRSFGAHVGMGQTCGERHNARRTPVPPPPRPTRVP